MHSCRICNSSVHAFMSFGRMPIANGFLLPSEIDTEYFFELAPAFCEKCGIFQILEQPAPEKMFHGSYAFHSSTSRYMQLHFKSFAGSVMESFLKGRHDAFAVEIGSNDGIMLRHLKEAGYRHLGIEPSVNVADIARAKGIQTISEFFNKDLAERVVAERGHADAVLAANVVCHIQGTSSVAGGSRKSLKLSGACSL